MLLSEVANSLTIEEWNVAYFLGLEELYRHPATLNFTEQVVMGTKILTSAGYRLQHLALAPTGWFVLRGDPVRRGEHDTCCREIANHSFDMVGRAKETFAWISRDLPGLSTEWLAGLIALYDKNHPPAESLVSPASTDWPTMPERLRQSRA